MTRGQFFVCTVFPAQSLPVTGSGWTVVLLMGGGFVAVGGLITYLSRRR